MRFSPEKMAAAMTRDSPDTWERTYRSIAAEEVRVRDSPDSWEKTGRLSAKAAVRMSLSRDNWEKKARSLPGMAVEAAEVVAARYSDRLPRGRFAAPA